MVSRRQHPIARANDYEVAIIDEIGIWIIKGIAAVNDDDARAWPVHGIVGGNVHLAVFVRGNVSVDFRIRRLIDADHCCVQILALADHSIAACGNDRASSGGQQHAHLQRRALHGGILCSWREMDLPRNTSWTPAQAS
jgi:hypothetical protein